MLGAEGRIGQLLSGKYRVQEHLASGGMGIVYAGRHEATGRAVALKLLRPELAARRDLVERVAREARLAVEASHPNVVQVLDVGADEAGIPYLVLERLYGEPLDALLEQPLGLRASMQALVPVVNALAMLHQAGIVHRDLKPSNIFLSREQGGRVTPKLLDFGIAKVLQGMEATLTGVTLGTPAYMAPEQVLGCSEVSPASDVWSLAVVCVRCLTGRLPFEQVATRGFAVPGGGIQPADLPGVPEPLARVLAAALRWEAPTRPANALELRRQWLAALQQIEPDGSWPNEASFSFEPEADLARALSAALAQAEARDASAAGFARPRHVITRTLSRVWESVSLRASRRWLRRAGLALLVAGGLVAAGLAALVLGRWAPSAALRSAGTPGGAAVSQRAEPLQLSWGRPESEAAPPSAYLPPAASVALPASTLPPSRVSAPPTSAAPASPRASPPLRPPPRARHGSREPPPTEPRGSEGEPEAPAAAAAAEPAAPEAIRARPLVGANRSPIIE